MKIKYIIIAFMLFILSCNLPSLKKPEFKPDISLVKNEYKNRLESEAFSINTMSSLSGQEEEHWLVVTIYNSIKIPTEEEELDKLGFEISSKIYPLIINKNDYTKIEVLFQTEIGINGANIKRKINFFYPFDELTEN